MGNITQTVEEVFSLYEKFGGEDYIGEPVSQLEHMSQSAQLALQEGFDDEVVLAAFFHDIGHLCGARGHETTMDTYGIKSHEKIGADYLRKKGFPEQVARLVENHVAAKRYLTFKYPQYYDQLSEASKKTLEFQGGKMTRIEAENFEQDPQFEVSILLRRWDELAKETNIPIMNLDTLKAKAVSILQNNTISL
ncbi:MAG: HDIG domain-containing protein [Flammeovirgaceae bacterium]|nr:HDIG domain-containing protein [Flammeovirgaceae bacterium]